MAVNGYILGEGKQMIPNQAYLNANYVPEMGNAGATVRGAVLTPQQSTPTNFIRGNGQQMIPNSAYIGGQQNIPQQAVQQPNVDELYQNYINQYSEANPSTANLLKTQYNDYGAFSESARNINNLYNNLYNSTDPYYNNFARINQNLDQDIVGKLNNQLQTAYSQYGPEGEQTKRVQDFYRKQAENIAAQNAVNLGTISAQAAASGANTGAQRSAINQAQIGANDEFLKLKQAEIQNYDGIYQNLNQYIDNFVKTYANSKDKYVRDTYNQLLQYKNAVEQARANSLISLEGSRLQKQLQDEAQAKALASARAQSSSGASEIPNISVDQNGRYYFVDTNGRVQYITNPTKQNSLQSVVNNNLPTTALANIQNALQ